MDDGPRQERLAVGLAALLPCDSVLEIPPDHPMVHPGFTLVVDVEDERVVHADVEAGLMHRSAEKLFEARDYRQAMLLANRHDWLSSFCSEVTIALAAEDALGIAAPPRAAWIRTLLVEAQRASAALAFLVPVAGPLAEQARRLRERFADVIEQLTGSRVHPGFARIGGVAHAVPERVLQRYDELAADAAASAPLLAEAVAESVAPWHGLGVLTSDQAVDWGTSGVVARASGVDLDLRRDDPRLAYPELADRWRVGLDERGDVPARYALLAGQIATAGALIAACVAQLRSLGPGEVGVRLPKVVRLPEGTTYAWLEGPLGICGAMIVSTGDRSPWRLKIRSASFATLQATTAALVGAGRDQIVPILTSFPVVMGDVDR